MSAMPAIRGSVTASTVLAVSRPARTFTGDFYVTHRNEDRLWLALGDVAGKGLPAAIVMAMIQEELEHRIAACAETQCNPATTMQRLHEFLEPLLPSNRFATVVIAHLRDDGELMIANGGHCPPLIVRRDGSIDQIASTGQSSHSEDNLVALVQDAPEPGEALLLYSDGVTESVLDGEELGVEGLRALVARVGACPRSIAEALGVVSDDLTLVVVTRSV